MNDVEVLVNNHADVRSYAIRRAIAQRKKRQLKKLVLWICAFAASALCALILWVNGAVHDTLAALMMVASSMAGCFTLGLYVAKVNRK